MMPRFMIRRLFIAALLISVAGVACRRPSEPERRTGPVSEPLNSQTTQMITVAVERVLRQLKAADLGYSAKDVCFSTRDAVSFEPPDSALFSTLKTSMPGLSPATNCMLGDQIGRIVDRQTKEQRLLLFVRPYVYDDSDRSVVVAGWYEHTMSARRYLFMFRRVPGGWKMEEAVQLGVV